MGEKAIVLKNVGMKFNLSKEKVDSLKDYLISSIKELKELSEQELVQKRYEKFRKM